MAFFLRYWKVFAGIALALTLVVALYAYGARRYTAGNVAGKNEVQQAWDAAIAIGKDELLRREREARAMEQRHSADMARIGTEYAKEKEDAGKSAYERAIADVRSGRLRNVWTCPASGGGLPSVGPSAGSGNDSTDIRAEAVARVLRLGAEADAQVRACQAVIIADRNRETP